MPHALRAVDSVDSPSNVIEHALSGCPKHTEAGQTDCVRAGLKEAGLGAKDLLAMVPGCHYGQVCHYTYSTKERIGVLPSTAIRYVMNWQIDFDLTKSDDKNQTISVVVTQKQS